MGWFSGGVARFRSPFSPEACVQRLGSRIGSQWAIVTGTGFAGSISSENVAIGRKYILAHNSLQTWFVGRIEKTTNGSNVIGAFRITRGNAVAMCFMGAWFLLIGGTGTIIGTGQPWGHVAFGGCTLLLMLVLLGFYRFSRWLARNDERAIAALIIESLMAERLD